MAKLLRDQAAVHPTTESGGRTSTAAVTPEPAEQPHPKGALFATLLYLGLVVVLWGYMYLTLLQRR